jgi:hypothetical protein
VGDKVETSAGRLRRLEEFATLTADAARASTSRPDHERRIELRRTEEGSERQSWRGKAAVAL